MFNNYEIQQVSQEQIDYLEFVAAGYDPDLEFIRAVRNIPEMSVEVMEGGVKEGRRKVS